MKARIFRAVVCLLVVCCLVCNCALPSQATGVELIVGTAISVAAVTAVGSMLVGLGVSPGSDQTVFDDLVNGAVDMFTEAGKVAAGMMSIWSLTNSSVKYAVEPEIIEMLREWLQGLGLFSEKTVSLSAGRWMYNGVQQYALPSVVDLQKYPYIILGRGNSSGDVMVLYTSVPLVASKYTTSYYKFYNFIANSSCDYVQYVVDTSLDLNWRQNAGSTKAAGAVIGMFAKLGSVSNNLLWANYDLYGTSAFNAGALILEGSDPVTESGSSVSLVGDYTAGYIAPSADSLADGYADWAQNSITLPGSEADDEDRVLWPMGLGPDYLGTISKPQPDIWDGTSEYTIPDAVTGITISSPDSVTTGGYITIQADVTGTGDYDMLCSCTVAGATSTATHISAMEFDNLWALECGADEEADTLTITVASVADPAIAVTKEIAVVKSETEPGTDTEVETGTYTGILDTISGAVDRVAEWCSVLVDTVVNIPYTIIEGIKGLFIPDAAIMAAQQEKWTELLEDRFGGMYESGVVIHNLAAAFAEQEAQTTIIFPRVEIPLGDVTWVMGAWQVPVVPVGFESFVTALKKMIDLICTLAFLNALKSRFERVLEGFE